MNDEQRVAQAAAIKSKFPRCPYDLARGFDINSPPEWQVNAARHISLFRRMFRPAMPFLHFDSSLVFATEDKVERVALLEIWYPTPNTGTQFVGVVNLFLNERR